jgi:hypothetical protein
MDSAPRIARVFKVDSVLLVILIGSLSINVYLGTRRERPVVPPPQVRPALITEGTAAPVFRGTYPTGASVSLQFRDNRSTLLYVFSPTCRWCERNLANIKSIISARRDLRIIGVNIGPKLDVDAATKQPFPEIVQPDVETIRAFHFSGTPSTVLITGGIVVHSWEGAYSASTAAEIAKAFAVSLPGLLEQ